MIVYRLKFETKNSQSGQ